MQNQAEPARVPVRLPSAAYCTTAQIPSRTARSSRGGMPPRASASPSWNGRYMSKTGALLRNTSWLYLNLPITLHNRVGTVTRFGPDRFLSNFQTQLRTHFAGITFQAL